MVCVLLFIFNIKMKKRVNGNCPFNFSAIFIENKKKHFILIDLLSKIYLKRLNISLIMIYGNMFYLELDIFILHLVYHPIEYVF